jgi:Uma2 family endonuclease
MLTVTRRHFTLEEYHRLGELGFFGEEERVELIRGEIIQMPTKKPPHSVCNTLLWQELYKLIEGRAILRVQEPIILPADSEPQPDVAIVRNQEDNYLSSHPYPEDILLLIEVADSTLKYDQETKLRLYAEAGISEFWHPDRGKEVKEAFKQNLLEIQRKRTAGRATISAEEVYKLLRI